MATYSQEGDTIVLTTNPFEVVFSDTTLTMVSIFRFPRGKGKVEVERKILKNSGKKEVTIEEYMVACYGKQEYSLDMTGITLEVEGKEKKSLAYEYRCRSLESETGLARAIVPQIKTVVELEGKDAAPKVEEGIAFSPMFRLSVAKKVVEGGLTSCLSLKKEN
jgi:ribosomal 50S subunit-recycling heat shock protein